MASPLLHEGPVWESEEGRALSGFRLGLAPLDCLTPRTKVKVSLGACLATRLSVKGSLVRY
jgi:hypothetical protein